TKYEDWKAFTKIFMKATKKKREKLPKNSSNKNLTQSRQGSSLRGARNFAIIEEPLENGCCIS
ncbi:hypothetical protein ACOSZF_09065, partial [Cytobacillus firmus]|uniref:hypothetical protein n=1 Tax=Cytobacillus firmus TaxID=1399 RepID=UPI003B9E1530